jgi:hypothetical protein
VRPGATATACSSLEHNWKRRVHFLAVGLVCFATTCGAGGGSPVASPTPSPVSVSLTPRSSPSATFVGPPYPNLSRFTDPIDQLSYKSAYGDCGLLGTKGSAEAYGGNPADPPSVARAFANATYTQETERREAAFQGCLDALNDGTTTPGG